MMENLGFKIMAIVVAVVLWFGVKTEREAEVRYPVPLEVVPESDEEAVLSSLPPMVEVVFSGPGKELLRLGEERYRVRKILEPGETGPRRIILDSGDVTGGNLDVQAVSVQPGVLTIVVDDVVSKKVPLRAGELETATGYETRGGPRFQPASVTLIGAQSVLDEIDSVPVDLTPFRGARQPIRRSIIVHLPDYPGVIVQPDSVLLVVGVQEAGAVREPSRGQRS